METRGTIRYKRKLYKNSKRSNWKDKRLTIYLLAFLFTLHLTPAAYINSSFIEQFTGRSLVGIVYVIISILTIFGFIIVRRALQKFGNYAAFMFVLWVDALSLIFMSLSLVVNANNLWGYSFVIAFMLGEIARSICFLNLDIFLENISDDRETGSIRGIFLTSMNMAFVIGPIIAGFLITEDFDIGKVYVWGALIILVVIMMSHKNLKKFADPKYEKSDMWATSKIVLRKKNIYRVFMATFLLNFFYALMVIYTPIFLHDIVGLSFSQIGLLIGVSLIPFILLQIPLGKIADTKLGEKELMTTGFIIMGLSTITMSLVSGQSDFWIWILVLFITRVGASVVEIMAETYLFKNIASDDINIIGLYRAIRPLGYMIGPIVASIFIFFVNIPYLFILLGVIMLCGIRYSLTLKDTL